MQRKLIRAYLLVPVALAIAILACNLPASSSPLTLQPTQIVSTQTEPIPVETIQAAAPTQQVVIASPEAIVPTSVPEIVTNLPVVVMEGGNGYIFSTQQITNDDRDIWWNGIEFVPAGGYRMVSLGNINPLDVNALTFAGVTPLTFEPVLGDAYGIEITRDNRKTYAIIRVVKVDAKRRVTFDWVYPFAGAVTSNP